MRVCVCVCVCVYIYICVCVCVYIYIYVCVCVCVNNDQTNSKKNGSSLHTLIHLNLTYATYPLHWTETKGYTRWSKNALFSFVNLNEITQSTLPLCMKFRTFTVHFPTLSFSLFPTPSFFLFIF